MSHKIGQRIREVLTAQQAVGSSKVGVTAKLVPHIGTTNVAKYLDRAVERGFATVDTSQAPKRYAVKPNWQALIDAYERQPKVQHSRKPRVRGFEALKPVALPKPHPLAAVWV